MPTSTGLLPMKTWIDWPVWTFTNFILQFLNFTTVISGTGHMHFLDLLTDQQCQQVVKWNCNMSKLHKFFVHVTSTYAMAMACCCVMLSTASFCGWCHFSWNGRNRGKATHQGAGMNPGQSLTSTIALLFAVSHHGGPGTVFAILFVM